MRFLYIFIAFVCWAGSLQAQTAQKEFVVYFETPLRCGAKETIGCGSRAKPLLLDLESSAFASEAWLNREGTYIAIVLKEPYLPLRQLLHQAKQIFDNHDITFKPVQLVQKQEELRTHLREAGKWYRGAGVDSLSWEEAAAMTESLLPFIEGFTKLSNDSAAMLRDEIRKVIGLSLINGGDNEDLHLELMQVSEKYVGTEATRRSVERYVSVRENGPGTYTSTITCPYCGYKKTETLTADRCIMEYTCGSCKKLIKHKKGDCCVFCSYGDVKCPTSE